MKESRKRRNSALDMNKKKRPRMKKHRPKIYDDSKPNKVPNSQSPNSSNPTPRTPKTPNAPATVSPNRVQKKSQNSGHNNSNSYGFQIATFKRNLPRSCRFRKKSLEASQTLVGDILKQLMKNKLKKMLEKIFTFISAVRISTQKQSFYSPQHLKCIRGRS